MTDVPTTSARRAIGSSGGVLAGRIAAYVGSLGTLVVTARQLGTSGRGTLVLVVTLTAFATLIFTLGLPVAARLHLVDADDPVPLDRFLGLAGVVAVATAALTPLAVALFLPVAHAHVDARTLALVAAYAGLNAALYLIVGALLAYGRLITASLCDAGGYVLQAVLCVGAALHGSRSMATFVAVLAVGMVPSAIIGLLQLRRLGHPIGPRVDLPTWRRLTRTGFPSLGTALCESATFRVDRLILGALATPAAVGIYSVGATAAEMIRFIPASVNQLVFYEVVMGRLHGRQLRRIRWATVAGLVAIAAVGAVLAPIVVRGTLGNAYAGATTPFRILVLAEIGFASYFFDTTVLAGRRHVGLAARAALVGLVAILVTDLGLIPPWGAAGAAWASVISYWVMAVAAGRILRGTKGAVAATR